MPYSSFVKNNLSPTTSALITVNLDALRHNYGVLQKAAGLTRHIAPVIKSNAYGLGMVAINKALSIEGAIHFFVATIEEGLLLRRANPFCSIYLLNGLWKEAMVEAARKKLTPVLASKEQIENWKKLCEKKKESFPFWIQIDTGLKRLGLATHEAKELATELTSNTFLSMKGILSHLACSYDIKNPFNEVQRLAFEELVPLFPNALKSFSNSGGLLLGKHYLYDIVRPGRFLYGSTEGAGPLAKKLKPVVSFEGRILQIQDIKKGDTVGYDRTFTATTALKVATCSVGYADGYFQSLSSKAYAMIGSYKVPVIGKISMDLMVLDVSHVPLETLHSHQWISFLNAEITLDQMATWSGTNVWEVLTHFGKRATVLYDSLHVNLKNA